MMVIWYIQVTLYYILLNKEIKLDKFEMFNKHINNYDVKIPDEEIEKLSKAIKMAKELIAKMKNNPLIYPRKQ